MALGSFGDSFADSFNQSYKTFREARLDREEREATLAQGREIAAAYGKTIASPAEEAAAMREGRTIQTPGMAQKLGLQKPRPTDVEMPAPANFQAPPTAALPTQLPGAVAPAVAAPQMQAALPAPATLKAAMPAGPLGAARPAAPPAQDDYVNVSLSPATALKGEGKASLQIPKEFTDSKGLYVTSDQWEKLAVAAARRGQNADAMSLFQKAADSKLAAVGTHMGALAANGDYKGLESFLNGIQDGSEAKIEPRTGGGYSFTYGEFKGQVFPTLDSIADFARKMAANDAPGIFQHFRTMADDKAKKAISDLEGRVKEATIQNTLASANQTAEETKWIAPTKKAAISLSRSSEAANYAGAEASRASAANSRASAEQTRREIKAAVEEATKGGLSQDATKAYEAELSKVTSYYRDEMQLEGNELYDAVQAGLDPWFNNSAYGPEVARALQAKPKK